MRVGMIEADHLEATCTGASDRIEVILRVDQKAVWVVGNIPAADGLDYHFGAANQDAAALGRRRVACVSGDGVKRAGRQSRGHVKKAYRRGSESSSPLQRTEISLCPLTDFDTCTTWESARGGTESGEGCRRRAAAARPWPRGTVGSRRLSQTRANAATARGRGRR